MAGNYSDYIVFVEESGDHGLTPISPDYPVFVLSFCVFKKKEYSNSVVPAITQLKFDTFGHDTVVLHEHEIRKKEGAFRFLGKESREAFMDRLTAIIADAPFALIAAVINKKPLSDDCTKPRHPYNFAMRLGLERLYLFLNSYGQADAITHVIFEARGKREDGELELEFRRVCANQNSYGKTFPFEAVFAHKQSNSPGLQFADMTARPVGLSILRPGQPNRALEVLNGKFWKGPNGRVNGYGLTVSP